VARAVAAAAATTGEPTEKAGEAAGRATRLVLPAPGVRTATLLCWVTLLCWAALLCRVGRLLLLRWSEGAALIVRLGNSWAGSQDLHACYA
jgi:hypothetical protein